MTEKFSNNAVTTLSAAITTTTATSCTVTDATAIPDERELPHQDRRRNPPCHRRGREHVHHHARGRGHGGGHARQHVQRDSPAHQRQFGGAGRQSVPFRSLCQQARRRGQGTALPPFGRPLPGVRRWGGLAPVRAVSAAQSAAADRLVVGQPGQRHGDVQWRCPDAARPRPRRQQSAASSLRPGPGGWSDQRCSGVHLQRCRLDEWSEGGILCAMRGWDRRRQLDHLGHPGVEYQQLSVPRIHQLHVSDRNRVYAFDGRSKPVAMPARVLGQVLVGRKLQAHLLLD